MLRSAYPVAAGVLVTVGTAILLAEFPTGALLGFPAVVIGLVQLLNWKSRGLAAGLRGTAIAAGPAFGAVLLSIGPWDDPDVGPLALLVALFAASVLSLPKVKDRRAVARTVHMPHHAARPLSAIYLVMSAGLAATGTDVLVQDLRTPGLFFGVGVLAACSLVLVSVVNILNWRYGTAMPGVRRAVPAINLAFLVVLWAAGWPATSDSLRAQVLFIWLPVVLTQLSIVVPAIGMIGWHAVPGGDATQVTLRTSH